MKQPNKSDLQKSHASLIRLLLTTAINQALKSALSTLFIFSFTCLVLQLKKCVPRVKNRFYLTTLKYCKKCNNNKQINEVDIQTNKTNSTYWKDSFVTIKKTLETNKFTSVFFPNLTNFCKLTNEWKLHKEFPFITNKVYLLVAVMN